MTYFDSTKFDYSNIDINDCEKLIQRDKNAYKFALAKWLEDELDNITDRKWEIDNIGFIEETGGFIKLIKESELSYSFGAYYSALALIGVACEDLCRYFAKRSGNDSLCEKTQFERVNELEALGVIGIQTATDFHAIRKNRNDMLHFNRDFQEKDSTSIKQIALGSINTGKSIYKRLFESLNTESDSRRNSDKIIESFAKEIVYDPYFGNTLNQEEFAMKLRSIVARELGVDIAIADAQQKVEQAGQFRIVEIDLDIEPKEMTLHSYDVGLLFIVDLSEDDIDLLKAENIVEGSDIQAAIYSITNHQGMTAEWRLSHMQAIGSE